MKLFVGMDVSLEKSALCVLNEHGEVVQEAEVACEPDAIHAYLDTLEGDVALIGLEAGPLSQWLHRSLADSGFDLVLMETRQVKGALKAMPIKTDRRDAEGIARLLHLGWFRPVHCKSVSAQELRGLLGARKAVRAGNDCPGDVLARIAEELRSEGRFHVAWPLPYSSSRTGGWQHHAVGCDGTDAFRQGSPPSGTGGSGKAGSTPCRRRSGLPPYDVDARHWRCGCIRPLSSDQWRTKVSYFQIRNR